MKICIKIKYIFQYKKYECVCASQSPREVG